MTESMLTALMKLFAILASINKDVETILSRNFVYSYLKTQFNQKIIDRALIIFDREISKLTMLEGMKESKRTSSLSVKVLAICRDINRELPVRSKYLILINLIQFSGYFKDSANSSEDFRQPVSDMVKTIAEGILLDEDEYNNCRIFITEKFYKLPHRERLLAVSSFNSVNFDEINHIHKENLRGQFFFLNIQQADLIIFYYSGTEKIELSNSSVFPGHIYIFPKGSALKCGNITPIYYSEIESGFLKAKTFDKISFRAENIEYMFPKSQSGIHKFSFSAESGDLIGILGGSGTGKSTLLRVLNGSLRLNDGKILINGHDLHSESEKLKGTIGYVPQDDLLIEELTVYQNLFFNARLCLGDHNIREIEDTVVKLLNNLDLFYIKDLRVGTPLNKLISGGQRKRLNIALELIREPTILMADEPTTGLSSTDSWNVMQLLYDLSQRGKIVIINIHNPSSGIFRMFNKLIILDKGGFPVYLGNPIDSFSYLKKLANRIDAADIECPFCGNVQPDEILEVIEAKHVNEFGEYTNERIIPAETWYAMFQKNLQHDQENKHEVYDLPASGFKTPGYFKQYITYSSRNLLSKLSDRQYVLFALLIAPVLALILSFLSKYVSGNDTDPLEYVFINNVNIPSYVFMSVLVALFIGLIISAEEIIKDRKILEREKFLRLSRTSYLNSKIVFLFLLSAIQMLIFVILGNTILEIKGMTTDYWLVLFSTICFTNLLGLNISSALRSVIAIYITIPFIMVPMILLSGLILKYDEMHYSISSHKFVPPVGNIMASRWAYEALVVNQFKNNAWQKHFYEIDRESANLSYDLNFLIPAIFNKLNDYERIYHKDQGKREIIKISALIRNSVGDLADEMNIFPPDIIKDNETAELNLPLIVDFLNNRKNQLIAKTNSLVLEKDKIYQDLKKRGMSDEEIISLKEENLNRNIADLVLNTNEMTKIREIGDRFIRKESPVYQYPASKSGRAQFYSGIKILGNFEVDTLWFNVMVLWLMTIILYIALVTDMLKKSLSLFVKRKKN